MTAANALMHGKRGLIMGVANDHSIAYGIARMLARHGAELAFTYQSEMLAKRVRPIAKELGSDLVLPCDVEDITTVDAVFARLQQEWGGLDFLVHSIAYSDKNELKGLYADTSRENFIRTMVISCFSFTEAAKRAAAMMQEGGAMLTVSFAGGTHVMPNYNVMGVAKGALELLRALSRGGFRRAWHSRQCDLARTGAHHGRRGDRRRTRHGRLSEGAFSAQAHDHLGRDRRLGALSAL